MKWIQIAQTLSPLSSTLWSHGTAAHRPATHLGSLSHPVPVHWAYDFIPPSHPRRPPLLLPSTLPNIRLLQRNKLSLWARVANDWSFSFNISPPSKHPGLVSRMTRLDFHSSVTSGNPSKHQSSKTPLLALSLLFLFFFFFSFYFSFILFYFTILYYCLWLWKINGDLTTKLNSKMQDS